MRGQHLGAAAQSGTGVEHDAQRLGPPRLWLRCKSAPPRDQAATAPELERPPAAATPDAIGAPAYWHSHAWQMRAQRIEEAQQPGPASPPRFRVRGKSSPPRPAGVGNEDAMHVFTLRANIARFLREPQGQNDLYSSYASQGVTNDAF